MTPEAAHYLKHVVVGQEWPKETTIDGYLESLKETILGETTEIFVSRYNEAWQIGFVGESEKWKGDKGHDFILLEYKVNYGHWVTGYQPVELKNRFGEKGELVIWLRKKIE